MVLGRMREELGCFVVAHGLFFLFSLGISFINVISMSVQMAISYIRCIELPFVVNSMPMSGLWIVFDRKAQTEYEDFVLSPGTKKRKKKEKGKTPRRYEKYWSSN